MGFANTEPDAKIMVETSNNDKIVLKFIYSEYLLVYMNFSQDINHIIQAYYVYDC